MPKSRPTYLPAPDRFSWPISTRRNPSPANENTQLVGRVSHVLTTERARMGQAGRSGNDRDHPLGEIDQAAELVRAQKRKRDSESERARLAAVAQSFRFAWA